VGFFPSHIALCFRRLQQFNDRREVFLEVCSCILEFWNLDSFQKIRVNEKLVVDAKMRIQDAAFPKLCG